MANIVDLEVIMDEIVAAAKSTLNVRLAALSTEKGDSMVLKTIDNAAYFIQGLNDRVANFDPFVFIYVDSLQSKASGQSLIKIYSIVASIIFTDTGEDAEVSRKAFRYLRALEETYQTYFAGISSGFKVQVESLVPTQFKYLNSSDEARAVGVTLTVGIA